MNHDLWFPICSSSWQGDLSRIDNAMKEFGQPLSKFPFGLFELLTTLFFFFFDFCGSLSL